MPLRASIDQSVDGIFHTVYGRNFEKSGFIKDRQSTTNEGVQRLPARFVIIRPSIKGVLAARQNKHLQPITDRQTDRQTAHRFEG